MNRLLPLMSTVLWLTACGGKPEDSTEPPADPALAQNEENVTDEVAPSGDEDCGTLEPLLGMLPTEKDLGGLPQFYRGCDRSLKGVTAVYTDGGSEPSELRYEVEVIDGNSRLLDSVFPQDLTAEERRKIGDAASGPGKISKVRLDLCRNYHANPVDPGGRNPLIVKYQGMDVCVMDTMSADKAHWFNFTFLPHLRVEIELTGPKAAGLLTTEAAAAYLMPLYEKFRFDAAPPP